MSRLSDELRKANTKNLGVRDISRRAKELGETLSPSNISNYLRGNHPERPPKKTLVAFAKVFEVPVSDLEEAATFTGREPFTPDPSSDRLTAPQRTAVNEIIRLLAEGNTGKGEGNADSPTPIGDAGGTPADEENVRPLRPDLADMAAYRTGRETEKERLDREAEKLGEEDQSGPEDWD